MRPQCARRSMRRPLPALDYLASAFVTLIVVVEPLGLAPIFLAATWALDQHSRTRIAARACLFAFLILAGAALVGARLLAALGVSLPAFRIAGGLLLFSIASEMVLGLRMDREAQTAEQALSEHVEHIAAFPLAIPLTAGPGAIAATLLLADRAQGDPMMVATLIVAIAAAILLCFFVYMAAASARRFLGASGNVLAAKLFGVLLAALAVQFVADGVRALLAS